jgi:AraC family transcriptional regulator
VPRSETPADVEEAHAMLRSTRRTYPVEIKTISDGIHLPSVSSSESIGWDGLLVERYVVPRFETGALAFARYAVVLQHDGRAYLHCRARLRERLYEVTHGEIVIHPPLTPHDVRITEPAEFVSVNIEPTLMARAAEDIIYEDRIELVPQAAIRDPFVWQIGEWLVAEAEADGVQGRLYAESLAAALSVHLIRSYSAGGAKVREYKGGLPKSKLRRVVEYINDNLEGELTLSDIAAVAGLNSYHFARVFKQSTGEPPHQYVINRRIERARVLLSDRELSLMEVCLRVGFQSQNHFTTLFRKRTGLTPKAYRDRL